MRRISTEELRRLEVINLCSGERLGYPCDFELDLNDGRITAFTVIPESRSFALFGERDEYLIPWCKIECIGEDAILIKMLEVEQCACAKGRIRKKHK